MENTQENPTSPTPTPADETPAAAPQEAVGGGNAELAAAQAKIVELQESFLRAKAETENTRRRAQEDVTKAHKFAIEGFAEHLLPVIDSLEAAMAHESGDIAKVREGVELTLRQLVQGVAVGAAADDEQGGVGYLFEHRRPGAQQGVLALAGDQP